MHISNNCKKSLLIALLFAATHSMHAYHHFSTSKHLSCLDQNNIPHRGKLKKLLQKATAFIDALIFKLECPQADVHQQLKKTYDNLIQSLKKLSGNLSAKLFLVPHFENRGQTFKCLASKKTWNVELLTRINIIEKTLNQPVSSDFFVLLTHFCRCYSEFLQKQYTLLEEQTVHVFLSNEKHARLSELAHTINYLEEMQKHLQEIKQEKYKK